MKSSEVDLYSKKEKMRMLMYSAMDNCIKALEEYGDNIEDVMDEISDIFSDLQLPLEVVLI